MRKLILILTGFLLVVVLVLMVVSTGLLPGPWSFKSPRTTPVIRTNLFSSTAQDTKKLTAEIRPELNVNNPLGQVTIRGDEVESVLITMEIEARAETTSQAQMLLEKIDLDIKTTEKTNQFTVRLPKPAQGEQVKTDLTIVVPIQTALELKAGLGDIQISNIQGNIKVFSQLGNIVIDNFQGDANLETALGDIQITGSTFDKELTALSHLGELYIQAQLAKINVLESKLGDIKLLLSPAEAYTLKGTISLGQFSTTVPFQGKQDKRYIEGLIGAGEERGSISTNLSLGSLYIKK